MEIAGKTALVTGAGRGIGRALAIAFASEGANVVCAARTEADVAETVALITREGGRAIAVTADVTQPADVSRLVATADEVFGGVDVLFNNAARIPVIAGLWEVDVEQWWDEIAVNLRGPMLCCRAVLPGMMKRNRGVIINMSGGQQIPGRSSYCCSKAALVKMTELLAKELDRAASAVIAFAMTPGLVKTRRTLVEAESTAGQQWNPGTRDAFAEGKDRPPEDCARATIQLLRRADKSMAGQTFATPDVLEGKFGVAT
jgi:NAD(P)-dependent dehydrogenase (short-subunit alcohol dehydrogenase family)